MRGNFITDRNGIKNPNYKDGRKKTRIYRIYRNILTRCFNPNYQFYYRYGGRGITICDEWKNDFKTFYDWSMSHGYDDSLSIDRIDNDGNYEPGNCRWSTDREQSINRSNNHLITIEGVTKTLKEWCETYNLNYNTAQDRLRRGWTEERVILEPVRVKYRKKVV